MTGFRHFSKVLLLGGCVALQGCQSLKTTLGLEREPPDEFAVLPSAQPLDMPPDFRQLPLPRPGAPRPQDVKAMQQKKEKSFGGKPLSSGHSSPGQKALLDLGGIQQRQENIRETVDKEHRSRTEKGRNVLRETLGLAPDASKEALDPRAEAKTLEEQGIAPGKKKGLPSPEKNTTKGRTGQGFSGALPSSLNK